MASSHARRAHVRKPRSLLENLEFCALSTHIFFVMQTDIVN